MTKRNQKSRRTFKQTKTRRRRMRLESLETRRVLTTWIDAGTPDASLGPNTDTTQDLSGLVVADFDGDGNADVALAGQDTINESISFSKQYISDGSGGFSQTLTTNVGGNVAAKGLAAGLLNSGSNVDLVYPLDNAFVPLNGNGNGTFAAQASVSSVTAGSVVVGDLNADGLIDVIVSGSSTRVHLNNGSGGYTSSTVAVGNPNGHVQVGDLNGDTDLDFVTVNNGSISIALNDGGTVGGARTFTLQTISTNTSNAQQVAVGDFDGDGDNDLAVSRGSSNVISFFENTSGVFAHNSDLSSQGTDSQGLVAADFNVDGHMDLAVANKGSDEIETFDYAGDGTSGNFAFTRNTPISTTANPELLAAGDMNGDGAPDLAVTHSDPDPQGFEGRFSTVLNNSLNTAPVLSGVSVADYTEDSGATALLTQSVTISDVDDTELSEATVAITSGYESGVDVLAAGGLPGGITANFDVPSGTLTLSGTASFANYVTALNLVTFENASNDPSTTDREITITITDANSKAGSNGPLTDSAVDTFSVTATNDPPSFVSVTADDVNEGSPVVVSGTVADPDSADTLIVSVDWDNDGTFDESVTINPLDPKTFSFTNSGLAVDDGSLNVNVRVADALLSVSQLETIEVNNLPPTFDSVTIPATGTEKSEVFFAAAASDPAGANDPIMYSWEFGDGNIVTGPNPSFTFQEEGEYTVKVTASDDDNGTVVSSDTITIAAIDETAPTAVVGVLPVFTGSDPQITLDISFDDSGPAGEPVSGVATYDVLVAVNNGSFSVFANDLPVSQTQVVFNAQSDNRYWFQAIATDVAGNEEQNLNIAEANTYTGDFDAPVSSVTSAIADSEGMFTVMYTATDQGGSGLASLDVLVSVDGGTPTSLVASPITINGVDGATHTGTLTYQGLRDGAAHEYVFYTVGTDGSGNVEAAPGTGLDQTVNATFAAPAGGLATTGIDVQNGETQRSFVRFVDVLFNDTVGLNTPTISVERFAVTETNPVVGNGTAVTGFTTSEVDNSVLLDFGSTGIGGSKGAGDGFYRISIDIGGTVTHYEFFRLFGDADGNGTVETSDRNGITEDLNGDGRINSRDRRDAHRARGNAIDAALLALLDD